MFLPAQQRCGKCGKKGINLDFPREAVKNIPIKNRTMERSVAAALGIPKTPLRDYFMKLGLRAVSCYPKPLLTDNELRWSKPSTSGGHKFYNFEDHIHLDEKWFYICPDGQTYYVFDGKVLPTRKVLHKSHVAKVMLLAAVARPRLIVEMHDGLRELTGKIGIFPVIE